MKPKPVHISKRLAGRSLYDLLQSHFRCSATEANRHLSAGKVRVDGSICRNGKQRVAAGQKVEVLAGAGATKKSNVSPSDNHGIHVLHLDAHIVAVDKPAGLTTVRHAKEAAEFGKRARKFLPPTLTDLLPGMLDSKARIRPVHRLDKSTTGILVFARTQFAERHLGLQFRAHSIKRRYLALVRGQAKTEIIESYLVQDRGDGRRGSSDDSNQGQRAVTHVTLLEDLGDYSLVECRLETGRTHQVRIHLGECGTPLCGERVYDRPLHGQPLPDGSNAKRPLLHASFLEIEHPATGKRVSWRSNLPADMKGLLRRLKKSRKA